MKNKIKLVCTDIDGTLNKKSFLSHDLISSENIKALNQLADKNISFVIATGRDLNRALQIANKIKKKCSRLNIPYIIALNGAVIYDCKNKSIIENVSSSNEVAKKVVDFLSKRNVNCFCLDSSLNLHIFNKFFSMIVAYCWFYKYTKYFIVDDKYAENIKKIMVVDLKIVSYLLKDELEKAIPEVYVACSGKYFLEAIDRKVNKFYALEKVLTLLAISKEEVCALGNEGNDLLMIESVGFGIAVDFYKNKHISFNEKNIKFHADNILGIAFAQAYQYIKSKDLI